MSGDPDLRMPWVMLDCIDFSAVDWIIKLDRSIIGCPFSNETSCYIFKSNELSRNGVATNVIIYCFLLHYYLVGLQYYCTFSCWSKKILIPMWGTIQTWILFINKVFVFRIIPPSVLMFQSLNHNDQLWNKHNCLFSFFLSPRWTWAGFDLC